MPRQKQASLFDLDLEEPQSSGLVLVTQDLSPVEVIAQAPAYVRGDDKLFDLFADTVEWALLRPFIVTNSMSQDERDFLIPMHAPTIRMERFITAIRFWKSVQGQSYREIAPKAKDMMNRLTNREACLVMSALSLLQPLPRDCEAEYMRAFAASFGVEQYCAIQGEWFEAININECQMLRYGQPKARDEFPLLDIEWIARFNQEARARFEELRQENKDAGDQWPALQSAVQAQGG